jgi:DNA polymerase-3 subunit epsilon
VNRHRARGDAHATALLFHRLLRAENAAPVFKKFLNAKSQEATLPAGLPKSEFEKLPSGPGIYYFKNNKGAIIYVGKAINIKKRVLGHFYDKAPKEVALCAETCYLDFKETGCELIALLEESGEIKQHYPKYNRAQKRNIQPYAIFSYEDRNGVLHLAYNKQKLVPTPLKIFYSPTACRSFLETLCDDHGLCPKYCHLQENIDQCSHYKIKECMGICTDLSLLELYNDRVRLVIDGLKLENKDYAITTNGRTSDEIGFVLIQDNLYQGFGYLSKDSAIERMDQLEPYLNRQRNTMETQRIIEGFITRNKPTVVGFTGVIEPR